MSDPATATEVMRRCLRHWSYSDLQIIPRCCLPGWEADLLVIRPSGWVEEVEIKISASDFRAEWKAKAEKHEALREGVRVRAVANARRGKQLLTGEDVSADPTLHQAGPGHPLTWWYVRRLHIIRRFWFAMPRALAERLLPEVPETYGVLAVGSYNEALQQPRNLRMARKLTDQERLRALQSTYYRFWRMLLREPEMELGLVGGME